MKRIRARHIRNVILVILAVFILLVAGAYILAQVYRKEILAEVNKSINEKISGHVSIRDIDFTIFSHFPSLSLSLEGLSVRDSLYPVHHTELFHADKIFLQLEILKLLRGEINLRNVTIQNATFSLLKMSNGYKNFDIIKKDTSQKKETETHSSLITTADDLTLRNVSFNMVDSTKNKWFRFQLKDVRETLGFTDSAVNALMVGNIHFGGLAFNAENGSFLTDKDASVSLFLTFNFKEKKLRIHPSSLMMDKNIFALNGFFEFSDTSHMHLEILAKQITLNEAKTILTQHIADKLSLGELEKPVISVIYIDGRLYPGSKPAVDVFFRTENNTITMKTKSFDDVNMLGWFLNHIDSTKINDDHNSRLILPHFTGNLGGIPLQAKMVITDLLDPQLVMDAKVNMSLTDASDLVDSSLFDFEDGTLAVKFKYDGKLVDYVDTVNHLFLAHVNGSVKIENGQVYYVPRNFQFENVNTYMTFDDSLLAINQLQVDLNKNPISVSGIIHRFIPYLFIPGNSLYADMQVNASALNFDNFESTTPVTKKAKKKSAETKLDQQKKISNILNNILSNIEADIMLNADQVTSKRFKATDVKGQVAISDDSVHFKNVNMQTSGGTFILNGGVSNLNSSPYLMNISASIANADISNLFYSFDNFDQKTITHKNLKGQLTTSVNFSTQLKKDYSILPKTMKGRIILLVKNGALINFSPMNDLSKYVFKNRGLDSIEFASLKDTITIKGQDMLLSRMQIQSSAFSLFLEGTYSFAGNTDLSIQIPLSNLKKRGDDYKPTNVSNDTKMGPSIFLRAVSGTDGNTQIKYDMFKNYNKEKQAVQDSTAAASDSTQHKKEKKHKKDK